MTYAAYIFDLDGTLYSRDLLVGRVVRQQARDFADELSHVQPETYVNRVLELDAHGYCPKEEVYAQIASDYDLDDSVQSALFEHFWDTYDSLYEMPESTLTVLRSLNERGARLGIVTNGKTKRQNGKIDAFGIRDYFDAILVSESEGLKKPEAEIFHRAVTRCGCGIDESVFIGDHPEADIEGARNAGLPAIWKRVPYWQMTRDDVVVIEELSELLEY